MAVADRWGKIAFGAALVAVGALTATGFDHVLERAYLSHAPIWLLHLTTGI
jgi:hypothetical protein